jgi:hypothetical protein
VAGESLAGVWRRALAWILDVVAVSLLVFIAFWVLDEAFEPTVRVHPEAATLQDVLSAGGARVAVNSALGTALSAGYFVASWVLLGATPAQLLFRMRVRREGQGVSIPTGRALLRWILLFPPFSTVFALTAGTPLVGVLVWPIAAAWYLVLLLTTVRSERRQGLHDRIADSVVLTRRARAAYGGAGVR